MDERVGEKKDGKKRRDEKLKKKIMRSRANRNRGREREGGSDCMAVPTKKKNKLEENERQSRIKALDALAVNQFGAL